MALVAFGARVTADANESTESKDLLPYGQSVCKVLRMAAQIIGIIGKAMSGKDTIAARLVAKHGFTRLAFADPLKNLLLEINPLVEIGVGEKVRLATLVDMYGWEQAKSFPEVRALLQRTGVSVREYLGDHVWISALAAKAALVPGPVVVSDVRFRNEARWVQAHGQLVRVSRPALADEDRHVSENDVNAWVTDHVIINDRLLPDLNETVDRLVASLAPRRAVV